MWSFKETYLGVTYPVSTFYILETFVEHEFPEISILATNPEEVLDFFNVFATLRFVTENETFDGPLRGSDFLTEQTGTLFITITETFPTGLFSALLASTFKTPGICGFGLCGGMQAGNLTRTISSLAIVIQIQGTLPAWNDETVIQQPHIVDTVTCP